MGFKMADKKENKGIKHTAVVVPTEPRKLAEAMFKRRTDMHEDDDLDSLDVKALTKEELEELGIEEDRIASDSYSSSSSPTSRASYISPDVIMDRIQHFSSSFSEIDEDPEADAEFGIVRNNAPSPKPKETERPEPNKINKGVFEAFDAKLYPKAPTRHVGKIDANSALNEAKQKLAGDLKFKGQHQPPAPAQAKLKDNPAFAEAFKILSNFTTKTVAAAQQTIDTSMQISSEVKKHGGENHEKLQNLVHTTHKRMIVAVETVDTLSKLLETKAKKLKEAHPEAVGTATAIVEVTGAAITLAQAEIDVAQKAMLRTIAQADADSTKAKIAKAEEAIALKKAQEAQAVAATKIEAVHRSIVGF